MIEEPPVLTLRQPARRPTATQIAAFAHVPTGYVVDAMTGQEALSGEIAAMQDDWHVVGSALTAWNGPADVLATLAAIHLCQPGDILIASVDGARDSAAAGDRVCGMAKNAGAVALVTDGAVRDTAGIKAVGLPVWCAGRSARTPYTSGPGTVGYPVVLGGRQIESGDLIVADRDGVAVVPFNQIDAVIAQLKTVRTLEEKLDKEVEDGFCEPLAELLASDRVVWK